jgi:host factor-I protein
MSIARPQPLQDAYLGRGEASSCSGHDLSRQRFQLRGIVKGFDPFTIVLEYEKKAHLIYKHAVSTISPQGPVSAPLIPEQSEAVVS